MSRGDKTETIRLRISPETKIRWVKYLTDNNIEEGNLSSFIRKIVDDKLKDVVAKSQE